MVDQGPCRSRRTKGFPLEEYLPSFPPSPHKLSNEGTVNKYIYFEVRIFATTPMALIVAQS